MLVCLQLLFQSILLIIQPILLIFAPTYRGLRKCFFYIHIVYCGNLANIACYLPLSPGCPAARLAPRIDLKFLKTIDRYKDDNPDISSVALKGFLGHLWYLSEI